MPRLGVLSKFYVNTGPVLAPTFNELSLISDCNVLGDWDEGEASARISRVKAAEPTMIGVEVTGKVRVADALLQLAFTTMYNAYFRDLSLDVLCLNGPLTENGASGYRFLSKVFTWSEDQSLGVVLFKDFSVKPCIPIVYNTQGEATYFFPKVANVVGGVLVYQDIGQG